MVLALGASVVLSGCDQTLRFEGVAIDPPRTMPAFEFVRADSTVFRTAPEPGRPLVLFFGYTHCPDVCPTTMADWKRVQADLGASASQVRFVFVSVDPERDTPTIAERYARQFDAAFVGLSGDAPTTSGIMEAFGVAAARDTGTSAAGYLVSHSSQAFLLNDAGALVAIYPFGTRWEALSADLKTLLSAKASAAVATPDVAAPARPHTGRVVREAWARPADSGATGGAYVTIVNADTVSTTLLRVSSPVARTVEVHESMQHDGMAHMMARPSLPIAARDSLTMRPGGLHLMLIDLQQPLVAGTSFPLVLHFSTGDSTLVQVPVRVP